MGRRKRDMTYLKPFCYYCEKSFKNQVFLHQHQKSKHFICGICPKKFSSIDSMIHHFKSIHKQQVDKVPNASQGHENVALKIFGMQGVPRLEIQNWIMKGAQKYWGKIIEKRNQKLRQELKQRRKEEEERQQQEAKPNMQVEKNDEKQEQVAIDFSIPINFSLN